MNIEEIKKIKKGDILSTSWGYDQTTHVYCRVEKNTGKTLKCQKIGKKLVESRVHGDVVIPDENRSYCKPFNLRISKYKTDSTQASIGGSYPFLSRIETEEDCRSKRRDYFQLWDGRPDVDTQD